MRADRDKRAAILTAEGMRQSAVLSAEGQKQSAILTAEGDKESRILRAQAERQARILKAQGEAQAITTVFNAIHAGKPDQGLLAYQYLQMLPSIAQGDANKLWIVPSEIGDALKGLAVRSARWPASRRRPRAPGKRRSSPTVRCRAGQPGRRPVRRMPRWSRPTTRSRSDRRRAERGGRQPQGQVPVTPSSAPQTCRPAGAAGAEPPQRLEPSTQSLPDSSGRAFCIRRLSAQRTDC